MNTAPGTSVIPFVIVFLLVAGVAAWALLADGRRLGMVLVIAGLAFVAYAVVWTFVPG